MVLEHEGLQSLTALTLLLRGAVAGSSFQEEGGASVTHHNKRASEEEPTGSTFPIQEEGPHVTLVPPSREKPGATEGAQRDHAKGGKW